MKRSGDGDPLRVLLATPDFPPGPGGIQILAHRIASHANAIEPRVITLRAPGSEDFDRGEPYPVRRVAAPGGNQRASVLSLNARLFGEARRHRPAAVLNMHIVTAPGAEVVARTLGIPFVQYLHASEVDYRPRLAGFAVRRAAATIAVSAHTAGLARKAGAVPERVHTIPPGVDLVESTDEPRSTRPTVITVARLTDRYKGHDVMLDALPLVAQHVPGVQWVVVGEGSLREELEARAATTGIAGRVSFLGRLSDAERDRRLARAHVFAMPSRRPPEGGGEGFGIAYLEAGAFGLPVVAGRSAGAVDAVVDGETGLLVDPEDHRAVAAALTDLLTDAARARALGERGRVRAQEFAWPVIARRVERVLLAVAS